MLYHDLNVLETSSHSDRPMCQIGYANVKANRSYRSEMKTWQKSINLSLRSKGNIESGTWIYVSDLLIVIDPCAKYGKPMLNQKLAMCRTQKHVKNPIDLPDMNMQTDWQTNRGTDRVISTPPPP